MVAIILFVSAKGEDVLVFHSCNQNMFTVSIPFIFSVISFTKRHLFPLQNFRSLHSQFASVL